ncbi:MAG TPA: hypothetical protein VIA45_01310 [Thermoanaerobaculia bacterium]|jgi:hypothetical protein
MRFSRFLSAAALAAGSLFAVGAQTPSKAAHVAVETAAPRPEDVSSIDGMIKAYYDVITGPAGQPRQWGRDRSLYIRDLRFVAMDVGKDGKPVARILSHQEFVDDNDARMAARGFDEREIHRVTERFGNIAHVFSTYETRRTPGGPLLGRGINSIELFWDGKRWWIANAIWDDERPDNPIPREYLP